MQLIWRLVCFAKPYRWWAMGGLLLTVMVMLANIALMGLSGWFITAMAMAGAANISMNYFTPAAIIRALAILRTGGRYGERLVTHEATLRVMTHLRRWCFEKLEPLAPSTLHGLHSAQLFTALREDTECIEKAYLRVFLPIIAGSIAAMLLVAFFYFHAPIFAALMLVLLLLAGFAVPLAVARWRRSCSQEVIIKKSQLTEKSIDYLQGMQELQLYNAETHYVEQIERCSLQLSAAKTKTHGRDSFTEVMVQATSRFALWVIVLLAIPMLQAEMLVPDNLTMLTLLALASFESIAPIPAALRLWEEVKVSAQRLFELTDRETTTPPAYGSMLSNQPDIMLDHVTLLYPERSQTALSDITLTIPYGEHIAITGATGSGKSSIASLISGLWQPQRGSIALGRVALHQLPESQLHSSISLAEQTPYLFADTIVENLRLAKPDASQEELEKACRIAQIHDFIAEQPSGYETHVGEHGVALSGGQKRRLGIARALLRDAPILILDEPSEGLDPETETTLLDAIMEHQQGRTLILITHREAGLNHVSRVIQIDQGKLIEKENKTC